jgi:hypothetical protein
MPDRSFKGDGLAEMDWEPIRALSYEGRGP